MKRHIWDGISTRLAIFGALALIALTVACGGGDDNDARATIDAAVEGTVSNQPTATPNVQATVDAAVAATASAGSETIRPSDTDLQATVVAAIAATESANTGPESPDAIVTESHPEKSDAEFYESRLGSLLTTDDIPDLLFGHETTGVFFTDFEQVLNAPLSEGVIAFTGLTFQGETTAVLLQVTDFETDSDAVDSLEQGLLGGEYEQAITVNGNQGARFSEDGVGGVVFVKDGSAISVLFTGSAVHAPEWEAIEQLAGLVEGRI